MLLNSYNEGINVPGIFISLVAIAETIVTIRHIDFFWLFFRRNKISGSVNKDQLGKENGVAVT